MLNLRFGELAKKESAPFIRASARRAAILEVFDGESLVVTCAPEKWTEALAAGEQELRRALEHGFQQAELDEMRAGALRGLDEAVEREATAASRMLLSRILNATENRAVPTDAETRRRILKPAIEALTVEACHEALKAGWAEGALGVSATGDLDLGDDAADELRAAYEASAKTPVDAAEKIETDAFAYASDPAKAGKIASREHVEDLDFHMVRFENGVALNVKRTDFRENQVMLTVNFGEGQLTADPKDVNTLQIVASSVMNGGGLEAHSTEDLRRITAGKQVGVGFSIGPDRFALRGGTTAEDLLLECELACASLTAPGWREDGLVQLRRQIPMMFMQMKHTPQGPMQTDFMPALFSGDPRYGMPSEEALAGCGVEEVRAWLEPVLADAPIEVTLIGDLDVDETIAAAARTFGMLPKRRDWKAFEERRVSPLPKTGLQQKHAIDTQIPKSLVLIVFPTTDGIEIERRRRLNMLNQVVMDRLRIEVREKLGAAYSPGSMAQSSEVNPGVGMLFMQAMSDPDKVDTLVEACLGVADSLAKDGVTDEELDRLREPILNRRRDGKRQNSFWMQILSRAQSDAAHLAGMRAGDAFYEGVEAAALTPLAKEYLPRERASILIVNPKPGE
jgi:zinc protease